MYHDVDVGDVMPIKQHPYRVNPEKDKKITQEIEYMLENNIIQPSRSNWSSPCVVVPKSDQNIRFCTDYRKVNTITKTDVYPIPRINDCVDRIGNCKYLTKIDLLKGYWCIPLTEKAKEVSAFVTSHGLYEYNVLPFGLKNTPATFQHMINNVIVDLPNTTVYLDDIVTGNNTWHEHLESVERLLVKLRDANLTGNLM